MGTTTFLNLSQDTTDFKDLAYPLTNPTLEWPRDCNWTFITSLRSGYPTMGLPGVFLRTDNDNFIQINYSAEGQSWRTCTLLIAVLARGNWLALISLNDVKEHIYASQRYARLFYDSFRSFFDRGTADIMAFEPEPLANEEFSNMRITGSNTTKRIEFYDSTLTNYFTIDVLRQGDAWASHIWLDPAWADSLNDGNIAFWLAKHQAHCQWLNTRGLIHEL